MSERLKKIGEAAEETAKSIVEDLSETRRLEAVEKVRHVIKTGYWKYHLNEYKSYYKFGKWKVKESCGYIFIELKNKTIEIFTAKEEEELKDLFHERIAEIEKRNTEHQRAAQIEQLLAAPPRTWIDKLFFFLGYSKNP